VKMVICNSGKVRALFNALCALDASTFEDWWIELFKSNTTVVAASILSEFSIADFPGYVHVSQTRAEFFGAGIVADRAQTENTSSVTFTCSGGGGQYVYGWLMVGKTSGDIFAGQNFDVPRLMNGGAIESLDPFDFALQTLCDCV